MPPALDRLLASPSALRALRAIVATPKLPLEQFTSTNCYQPFLLRPRNYSSNASTDRIEDESERKEEDSGSESVRVRLINFEKRSRGGKAKGKTFEDIDERKEGSEPQKPRVRFTKSGNEYSTAGTDTAEAQDGVADKEDCGSQKIRLRFTASEDGGPDTIVEKRIRVRRFASRKEIKGTGPRIKTYIVDGTTQKGLPELGELLREAEEAAKKARDALDLSAARSKREYSDVPEAKSKNTSDPSIWARRHAKRRAISSISSSWAQLDQESDVSQSTPTETSDKDMEIESNVTLSSKPSDIHLNVDNPKYYLDFDYWVRLLQFQERTRGAKGIRKIWRGMRERNIDLPTRGLAADSLWGTFIKDVEITQDVLTYAMHLRQRTERTYDGLYAKCLSHWLPRMPTAAYRYHLYLVKHLAPRKRSLQDLARFVRIGFRKSKSGQPSLSTFRTIYLESDERDVYDTLIPILYQRNRAMAQEWHDFLVRNNDFPSRSLASSRMGAELSAHYITSLHAAPRRPRSDSTWLEMRPVIYSSDKPRWNREVMSRLLGEAHDVKPKKEFDDAFCARLFATKSFSPTSVIKGLGMFGIEAIGPLTLREMGLRTDPLDEMPRRFRELKDAGVSIGKSVFSKAVEKFTSQNRLDLVRDLLQSDQHPDVLEDTKLQEELLTFYISKDDWRQVHRTLAILTIFHSNPEVESWNLLLQTHSKHFSGAQVHRVLEDMHANGIPVTHRSMDCLHADILRRRAPSKRPVYRFGDNEDDLRLLTNLWLRILRNGGNIPPWRWREILRRYGMTGRLRELRRLSLWLAAWYSPRKNTSTLSTFSSPTPEKKSFSIDASVPAPMSLPPTSLPPSNAAHPFSILFPPSFQRALVEWGFKAGLAENAKLERSLYLRKGHNFHHKRKHLHWTSGIETLRDLRSVGVYTSDAAVRKAVKTRMVILYGAGMSRKKENRAAAKRNQVPFQEMLRTSEEVWGTRLFHWVGREPDVEFSKVEKQRTREWDREKEVLQRQRMGVAELRRYLGD